MSVTHFICPGCGAEIRVDSQGCPKCTRIPEKKAKQKPWEQDADYDGLDLDLPEDDDFDYESFIADEFGSPPKRSKLDWLWWGTAVILIAALLYYFAR